RAQATPEDTAGGSTWPPRWFAEGSRSVWGDRMTSSDVQALTSAGAATCWAVIVIVWVAGAVYNAVRGPKEARRQPGSAVSVGAVLMSAIVAAAALRAVPASSWRALTVESPWVQVLGLAVLIGSTAFALWARAALGTMWSIAPVVKDHHQLRT